MRRLHLALLTALLAGLHGCAAPGYVLLGPLGDLQQLSGLPAPCETDVRVGHTTEFVDLVSLWQLVLSNNPALREAAAEVDEARDRRIQAAKYPNPTTGAVEEYIGETTGPGGIVLLETPIPIWDRNQGEIYAAQAHLTKAQAARDSTDNRRRRETAQAFARYVSARQQLERLTTDALPGLEESLRLVQQRYADGKNPEGYVDIQVAVETLNDARLTRAEARRTLWEAIADLQELMQLGIDKQP
jgi:cobalt-zinc-cadmium efflux system outer membrane protein